ncbi:uncharacterized protein BP01DRAFT_352657 [Aspergillus saccharolyticus JOP 1030-1]|uniref:Uncharacterized protein n=1 Tax=Aspergillus saccharolyticus JOP 1030-1 TaxID=1450539 RepID=A0A319ABU5_9EURO|nr:hypothetical protein BP01DRAFT_352657 [Aspergillus saccharolyticus JOP 1030-1]PYH49138.1 hypothetical protein BP01DRAFT_352657 [Aspergillus saccharolyticus JOP 1030-1]
MPTTTSTTPLTFYDIATRPPAQENSCSPNPTKTRLALNFKSLPYNTTWVPLPDVSAVRQSLHLPACRQFADGSDFYTLPILHDPNTNTLVGDSFDIAIHLQNTYPSSGHGDLFPPQPLNYTFPQDPPPIVPLSATRDTSANPALLEPYARFNVHVDAAFTAHTPLTVQGFPFDPATEETVKAEFVRRAQLAGAPVQNWADFKCEGEYRKSLLESFEKTLGGLAEAFARDGGPFVLGERVSYADFIVGGWLRMFRVMLPLEEWEMVSGWHGGVFGRLYAALEVFAEVK